MRTDVLAKQGPLAIVQASLTSGDPSLFCIGHNSQSTYEIYESSYKTESSVVLRPDTL